MVLHIRWTPDTLFLAFLVLQYECIENCTLVVFVFGSVYRGRILFYCIVVFFMCYVHCVIDGCIGVVCLKYKLNIVWVGSIVAFSAVHLSFTSRWEKSVWILLNYRTNFIKELYWLRVQRYIFNQVLILCECPFSGTVKSQVNHDNMPYVQRQNGQDIPQQGNLIALNGSFHGLPYWLSCFEYFCRRRNWICPSYWYFFAFGCGLLNPWLIPSNNALHKLIPLIG